MGEIKSSVSIAGNVSLKFSQAASELTALQEPAALAERTNTAGNTVAKSSGAQVASLLHQVADALVKDGNNIHSVAKEFAAIDQNIKQQFDAITFLSNPLATGGKK